MADDPTEDDTLVSQAPAGFDPLPVRSAFPNLVGNFYVARKDGPQRIGIRIAQRHCNLDGVAHGGFLLAVADLALSWGRADAADPPRVTLSIAADFIAPARAGEWLEAEVKVLRRGRTQAFVEGRLTVGERLVLRASGVFRPLDGGDPPACAQPKT